DEGPAVRGVGALQESIDAEGARERHPPGLRGEKGVGPALHQEAVHPSADDFAAQTIVPLDERKWSPGGSQTLGTRQPGDSATDDHDAAHDHPSRRAASMIKSANPAIICSSAFTMPARSRWTPRAAACRRSSTSMS